MGRGLVRDILGYAAPSTIVYERALDEMASLLAGGRAMTALQLAHELRCSKPTVYKRLRDLGAAGYRFCTVEVREGATGTTSTAYAVSGRPTRRV